MTDQSSRHSSGGTYVIEWTSEFLRKWWTGSEWSEDFKQAKWYADEPDGPDVTGEEGAHSVHYPAGSVDEG